MFFVERFQEKSSKLCIFGEFLILEKLKIVWKALTCHVHKIFFSLSALAGHLFSKSPTPSEAEWSLPYAYIRFKLMQYIFVMRFSK